jgi:limonene-1,2-epoxide hydrolase
VGATQEKLVERFLEAWGDGLTARPDTGAIAQALGEDVIWQLWLPAGPTLRGKAAVLADIERQLQFATHMHCSVITMTSNETTVVTERLDTFRSGDRLIEHSLCAVFDLDGEGKITAWREYFDVADLNRQLREANATVPRVGGDR